MKYHFQVIKKSFGEVVIDAENLEQARSLVSGSAVDYYDEEITGLVLVANNRNLKGDALNERAYGA